MKESNIAQEQIALLIAKNIPKQILSFKFSEELQNRIQKLVKGKKEGTLTPSELVELDKFLLYDLLIGLAKSKAYKS